jgi:hypothetical protein
VIKINTNRHGHDDEDCDLKQSGMMFKCPYDSLASDSINI